MPLLEREVNITYVIASRSGSHFGTQKIVCIFIIRRGFLTRPQWPNYYVRVLSFQTTMEGNIFFLKCKFWQLFVSLTEPIKVMTAMAFFTLLDWLKTFTLQNYVEDYWSYSCSSSLDYRHCSSVHSQRFAPQGYTKQVFQALVQRAFHQFSHTSGRLTIRSLRSVLCA